MDAAQFMAALEEARATLCNEIKELETKLAAKRQELQMLPGRKRAQRADKGVPRKRKVDAEDAVDVSGDVTEVVEAAAE